ncbi:hypothetical protein [Pseudofrankia saprophytica]|uniref:hypothetical protein n=1 Tax=Pseudofrankia saprophytica TaxID=298655 RepID=UPI0002D53A48|nr:hypothetical protein [Pseudofrankia saprophytica]
MEHASSRFLRAAGIDGTEAWNLAAGGMLAAPGYLWNFGVLVRGAALGAGVTRHRSGT